VTIKQGALALGLVFAIVLAVVVAKQMSTEAMAVVIGVVCGVMAGLPTSLLLLVALTRRDHRRLDELEQQTRQSRNSYPPMVVIQGGQPQSLPPGNHAGYWPMPQGGPVVQRDFTVVGGKDLARESRETW
jgi:hypothetical protein